MNLLQKIIPAIALLCWLPPVLAAGQGLMSLDRFYRDVKTFHARFEQQVFDEQRSLVDREKGEVWISRPGRFRWNYAPPDPQEIVGDGKNLWIHDVELEQVTVRGQAEALGRTPAILLAGEGGYEDAYEARDGGRRGGLDWVILRPREEESGFTEVRVGFLGRVLSVMELIDSLGQTTRIHFSEVAENRPIDPDRFRFQPPAGVDVIDERGE